MRVPYRMQMETFHLIAVKNNTKYENTVVPRSRHFSPCCSASPHGKSTKADRARTPRRVPGVPRATASAAAPLWRLPRRSAAALFHRAPASHHGARCTRRQNVSAPISRSLRAPSSSNAKSTAAAASSAPDARPAPSRRPATACSSCSRDARRRVVLCGRCSPVAACKLWRHARCSAPYAALDQVSGQGPTRKVRRYEFRDRLADQLWAAILILGPGVHCASRGRWRAASADRARGGARTPVLNKARRKRTDELATSNQRPWSSAESRQTHQLVLFLSAGLCEFARCSCPPVRSAQGARGAPGSTVAPAQAKATRPTAARAASQR